MIKGLKIGEKFTKKLSHIFFQKIIVKIKSKPT